MAVFFKGMTPAETAALTRAMMESGDCFTHRAGHPPVVDKHSTGGIGDKVSLVLAPLVACTGCWVPMVSGRGLGITGGTLDKLESIPGFNVHLGLDEAAAQLDRIGVVMMGQTERFCPADKKLYALRDVTGTVPSIPLITASIMSKKLAETLDRLVLDVKFGSGAFMRTKKDAEALAASMIAVGREMGVEVHAVLNPMSEPTGRAVGNVLEVIEALECLDGGGPADLREITLESVGKNRRSFARGVWKRYLDDGSARRKFDDLVAAQGGNPEDLPRLGGNPPGTDHSRNAGPDHRADRKSGRRHDRPGRPATRRRPRQERPTEWISRSASTNWSKSANRSTPGSRSAGSTRATRWISTWRRRWSKRPSKSRHID